MKSGLCLSNNKSPPSDTPAEDVEEVEGVEDNEDNVGVEERAEAPDPDRREPKVKVTLKIKVKGEGDLTHGTRLKDIQILHHFKRVFVTGPLGKVLIFVWNQGHVPGRTSMSPSPTNETVTSSALKMTTIFKICCTTKSYQKYIQ